MEPCISGGAKKAFRSLIEVHIKEATPVQAKTLTKLQEMIDEMPICKVGGKAKKPRKVSMWQLCVKEGRKGKKWDPNALKKLSKEYKAGTCPSEEFVRREGFA